MADPANPEAEYAVTPVEPASGSFTEAVRVGEAPFAVARLEAGATVAVPDGALRHLFVASGALLRNSLAEPLSAGDAYVLRGPGEVTVTAGVPTELPAVDAAGLTGPAPRDVAFGHGCGRGFPTVGAWR